MKLEAVSAECRFDQIAFSDQIVDGRALPLTATYVCPRCAERVIFSKKNFMDRAAAQVSNLEVALQEVFDEWACRNGEKGKWFLDWRCPGCALASRVYAHEWSDHYECVSGVDLVIVLEAHDECDAR